MIHPNATRRKIIRTASHVLTGASGGGKSRIIEALAERGHTVVEEPGRRIVQEQLASGGDATPWQDRQCFCELLFARSFEAYEAMAGRPGPVFFDRGIVEAVGYAQLIGMPVPPAWHATVQRLRYASPVFVTPPWREIFVGDGERRKEWDEVISDHEATVDAYEAAGYELVEVPRLPVAERAAFVLAQLGLT